MTEQTSNEAMFGIQRVYLKDLSLEQPQSPAVFYGNAEQTPQIDIQLSVEAGPVPEIEGLYEVCVTATVQTQSQEKTVFLIEAKQAGIFEIRHIPSEQMAPLMGITCPQIVYPYLRATVADMVQRAGFPPVHLPEFNFQAMFEAQQAQAATQAAQAPTNSTSASIH